MRSRIARLKLDREDGELVTIETSDGVTIEVCARVLWRSVPDSTEGASTLSAAAWVMVVSSH